MRVKPINVLLSDRIFTHAKTKAIHEPYKTISYRATSYRATSYKVTS